MHALITGGTGYIGATVLQALRARKHRVRALVRSDTSAKKTAGAGAEPVVGDLRDVAWLTGQLRDVDAFIHLAAPTPDSDDAVIAAALDAFAGTDRPFVHTSGLWIWGDNPDIKEDDPVSPTELTAWRVQRQDHVLRSGLKASVVAPGVVYGHGGGLPIGLFTYGPRTEDGALRLVGSGEQHWGTVHVEDLADLYVAVVERAPGGQLYIGASGVNPTVREMAQAAVGPQGSVAPETNEQTRERLGVAFADALLLDQRASGTRAKQQLGWTPRRPTVLEELAAR
jgi:nucleoside-diphosphate-sugar epimerase